MTTRKTLGALALSGVLALTATTGTALARHGSDDPAGHDRGDDHGHVHGKQHGKHHKGERGERHGGRHGGGHDDGPNHR